MTPGTVNLICRFPRHEIADFLGLSMETVSRVMAELKRAGIIRAPRGTMEIRDAGRLRAVASGTSNPLGHRRLIADVEFVYLTD